VGAWGGNAAVTQDVGSPRRRALGHRSCRPTDRPATDRPVIVRAVSTNLCRVAGAVPSLSGLRARAYVDSHRTREALSGDSESSATWNHQRDERLQSQWLAMRKKAQQQGGGGQDHGRQPGTKATPRTPGRDRRDRPQQRTRRAWRQRSGTPAPGSGRDSGSRFCRHPARQAERSWP